MSLAPLLSAGLWLLYPALVLGGLQVLAPRYLGLLLLLALGLCLLLRARTNAARPGLPGLPMLAGLGLMAAWIAMSDSESLFKLYPVAVNASLLRPPP